MRFGTQEIGQRSKHRQRDQAEAKTEEQKQGQTLLSISQGKMLEHFLQRDKDREHADYIHKGGRIMRHRCSTQGGADNHSGGSNTQSRKGSGTRVELDTKTKQEGEQKDK